MGLNPIAFTEGVVRSLVRYQLTAYPFADVKGLARFVLFGLSWLEQSRRKSISKISRARAPR